MYIIHKKEKTHFGYEGIRTKCLKNQARKISKYMKSLCAKLF